MLVCSSIVHRLWIVLRFAVRKSFAICYWAIYCFLVFVLVRSCSTWNTLILTLSQRSLTMVSWLIISGIPPFSLFWLKASLFISFIRIRLCWRILVIFSSVMALSVYFWAFHLSLIRGGASHIRRWFRSLVLFLSFLIIR